MNANYITYLQAEQKSARTIEEYTKYIQKMLDFVNKPDDKITFLDLSNWKASIAHLAPSSVSLQISAIKSYFNFLEDAELIEKNPAVKLKTPAKKNKEKPYPESYMIKAMVDSARTDRDKAIIMLFATTGLRVSELTGITLEQYKSMGGPDHREIKILGKGSKERTVYINDETKLAIDCYLLTRPHTDCDRLFLSFQGGPIHSNNLSQTLKSVAKNAGIPFWKDISNHWLRAAFATTQSEAGTPVATIQAAMGHASLSTTSIYIKHNQNEINNAMRKMAF